MNYNNISGGPMFGLKNKNCKEIDTFIHSIEERFEGSNEALTQMENPKYNRLKDFLKSYLTLSFS